MTMLQNDVLAKKHSLFDVKTTGLRKFKKVTPFNKFFWHIVWMVKSNDISNTKCYEYLYYTYPD